MYLREYPYPRRGVDILERTGGTECLQNSVFPARSLRPRKPTMRCLVRRVPQNLFAVAAVERHREIRRRFGAHNADSADACFPRGKNVVIAVAVVELTFAVKDVEGLIVLRFFFVFRIAVVNRLHVFNAERIADNFGAFVEFVPLIAFRTRASRNKNDLIAAFLMHIDEGARGRFRNRVGVGSF